jgi:hypothetical protein
MLTSFPSELAVNEIRLAIGIDDLRPQPKGGQRLSEEYAKAGLQVRQDFLPFQAP